MNKEQTNTDNEHIRLRFPPSPTGKIHIGNIRTALFNWLWARKKGGELVLRIEDTDQERSNREFEDIIIQELEWLGLDVDEGPNQGGEHGPYRQSERLDIYKKYRDKLLDNDKAYKCYCTPEELEEMRDKARKKGEMPRYDGRCRNLSSSEQQAKEEAGKEPVIRFKTPVSDKEIVVKDQIRGEVSFDSSVLDDFVIYKSDGMPTYNFAVVIDDALMDITDVIRGEDHLSNTPKQILLYKALDFEIPRFAHLPLIRDENKAKLKKRSGEDTVYVGEFRKKGYLPEALFNFLALLGWSPPEEEEILNREEIIQGFSLEDVNKSAAVFDIEKLNWMNGKYIRDADLDQIVELSLPYLREAGYIEDENVSSRQLEKLKKIIEVGRTGVHYLAQIPEETELFFTGLEFEDRQKAQEEFQGSEVELVFKTLIEKLESLETLNPAAVNSIFNEMREELPVGARTIYHPVRLALTGEESGPEMGNIIYILGIEEVKQRLENALQLAD